jgi:hypothetical protein
MLAFNEANFSGELIDYQYISNDGTAVRLRLRPPWNISDFRERWVIGGGVG